MSSENYRNQTENYIWDKNQVLGQGRVGYIFKGVHKTTGLPVAVKCLTPDGMRRSVDLQIREFDILKRLYHENIVKVLAIEDELFPTTQRPNGKTVIVMELCMGGSLHSVLLEPENHFGLAEDEFLTLYQHFTRVVRYMRDNNISHRDLKPANILKFIGEDGQIIFKVADFDTARDIDEDEPFKSIVGTPQYAHPDMFSRYLHRSGKLCSASVELWSIGATLFEAATGRLPFRPNDWHDLCTMYTKILNEKPSGMISGEQRTPNGPITWSDSLPKECILSEGLKRILCPLFAGLFERKTEASWNYQAFFDVSNNILERKRVHIFYLNRLDFLRVYLDTEKDSGYNDLLNCIKEQVNIPVESQVIFFKDVTLQSILGTESTRAIPLTSEESPLILCNKDESSIAKSWTPTGRVFKPFQNVRDLKNDAEVATRNMILCYLRKREIEKIHRTIQVFNSAVLTLNQVVLSQLMGISKENHQVLSLIQSMENQLNMMDGFYKSCQSFYNVIPEQSEKVGEELQTTIQSMGESFHKSQNDFHLLKAELANLTPALVQLLDGRVGNRSLILHWESLSRRIPHISHTSGLKWINKLERSFEMLKINPQDQQYAREEDKVATERACSRRFERLVMSDTCQILDVWSRRYFEAFEKAIESFSEFWITAQAAVIKPEILAQNMMRLLANLGKCEAELNREVSNFQTNLKIFTERMTSLQTNRQLQNAARDPSANRIYKVNANSLKELKGRISEQMNLQQEIKKDWEEHLELHEQLDKLSEALSSDLSAKLKMTNERMMY